jgi:hypothetical protein
MQCLGADHTYLLGVCAARKVLDMTISSKNEVLRNKMPVASAGTITQQELAQIGEGHVAYLKLMRSEDIRQAFPQAPVLAPGLKLFALLAADGTPIVLADSKAAALANAWEHELQTVSVH